ncbi:DUF4097 family beta strand repeat-containing protein [Actinocrinis sp.]|uniref:DUF4097 family beta strand repeat-containing protein n=1 Tax=Actinocrinis sp. TaxID=1920516 RepID=UPI002BD162B2|nr:DUF4097 family beta strand repeat-containing protein [Actinocrinis sp.]HXR71451.1 DUF4097 family beta strand repeat-containing protein [Actinocrinis sp.]
MNELFEVEDARPASSAGPAGPHSAAGPPHRVAGRKGQRALWFGIAGMTAVVTIAAVGLPQIGWLAAQTTTTTWISRHAITAVEVDVTGGDLTVRPTAGGEPISLRQTLTWTVNKPQVTETWQGNTLLINEDCAAPSFEMVNPCGADLELAVPATVSVQSILDSGSVTIKRMSGAVNARAQSGDIDLDGDRGMISARADSGDIHADGLASPQVNAQTLSGDVDLTFSSAPVSVTASVESGGVSVTVPRGATYRVSGQTSSGDRHVEQGIEDEASQRSIDINTQSGDASLNYAGDN